MTKKKTRFLTDRRFGYLLLMPTLFLFGVVILYPVARNVYLSFQDKSITTGMAENFVGFRHYLKIVTGDLRFRQALGNTIYFTVISVMVEFILGLGFALLLNCSFRFRNFARASVILPWALPTAVMAMAWRWIYHDIYGVANDLLLRLGILREAVAFLGKSPLAMHAAIFSDAWKTTSFMALMLLAGLQSIPQELYAASSIDGAGSWARFRYLTLPLLRPVIILALLFRSLQAFAVFDLIWVLTQGGPGGTTETLSVYLYSYTFRYLNLGYGSALSVAIFGISLVIILVILVFQKEEVELG
ncbi:MAG: carbohydrate ABC transporter permease [Candidatus Caldatribacteriaceae bacterium]